MNDRRLNILEKAGYRFRDGGRVELSGAAARLFDGWVRVVNGFLEPFSDERRRCPEVIASNVLETAGYLSNFRHQLVRASVESDTSAYATPAVCFHVYPQLSGRVLDSELSSILVIGRCSRHEAGKWRPPFRLRGFTMIELVCVGRRERVESKREEIQELTGRLFDGLGITGTFETATDAFFMSIGRGAQLIQRLKELKREYRVDVGGEKVAVASTNHHEDYFGQRFAIEESSGTPASSFCTAFGIERLTALGLLTWGPSSEGWPEELRT